MSDEPVHPSGSQDTASGHNSSGGVSSGGADDHMGVKQEGEAGGQQGHMRGPIITIHHPPMRARGSRSSSHPVCQVPGCGKDLAGSRGYHQRYKICDEHFRVSSMELNGQTVRFCQQCGKFQPLSEFHDDRRSCTIQLALHAGRRRKRHAAARAAKVTKSHPGGGNSGSDTDSIGAGSSRHRNVVHNRYMRHTMDTVPPLATTKSHHHLINSGPVNLTSDLDGTSAALTGLTEEEVRVLQGIIRNRGVRETAAVVAAFAAGSVGGGGGEVVVTSSRTTSQCRATSGGAVGMGAGNTAGALMLASNQSVVYLEDGTPATQLVVDSVEDGQGQAWLAPRRNQDSTDSAQTIGPYTAGPGAGNMMVTMAAGPGGVGLKSNGILNGQRVLQMPGGATLTMVDGQIHATPAVMNGGDAAAYALLDLKQQHQQTVEGSGNRVGRGGHVMVAPRSGGGGGGPVDVDEPQDMPVPPPGAVTTRMVNAPSAYTTAPPSGTTTLVVGPDGTLMQLVDFSSSYPMGAMDGGAGHMPTYMQAGNVLQHHNAIQSTMVYNVSAGGTATAAWGPAPGSVGGGQRVQVIPSWGGQQAPAMRVMDMQQLQQHQGGMHQFMAPAPQQQQHSAGNGNAAAPNGQAAVQYSTMQMPAARMQSLPQYGQAVPGGFFMLPPQAMGPPGAQMLAAPGTGSGQMNVISLTPEQLQDLLKAGGGMQQHQLQVQAAPTVITATN